MTTTAWHLPDDVLDRFARAPRELDAASASSAETHLVACARCRARVASATPPTQLDESWAALADRIDAPQPRAVERVLRLLGVRAELARLVAATPTLQLAWLASVAIVTALAVVAAHERDSVALYLALAPVLPLGSVAMSFTRGAEPGGEAAFAAPISGTALVLRRATAVVTGSLAVLVAGALALPGLEAQDVAWVLPALALSAAAVAGATWRPVEHVVAGLVATWVVLLVVAQASVGRGPLADSTVFAVTGQVVALAVALVAGAVVVVRRDRLATVLGSSVAFSGGR